jgi:structural maintenance of chromosome 3 (chondroitin sulfate proteoglycan 6)
MKWCFVAQSGMLALLSSFSKLTDRLINALLCENCRHKKDEFFLNRKRVQKTEVISLLESAGFSKSNPYYIVQQGKVANLCVMKDKDRLELLKEVAGTTVYEERRAESLKITQETTSKQSQIDEVLQFIEDRLSELEQEKDELKDYEQLDKSRRAFEYNLYEKELSKSNQLLRETESSRDEERQRQQDLYTRIREIQDDLQVEEDSLSLARTAVDRLSTRKSAKDSELSLALSRRSELDVQLIELDASINAQRIEGDQLSAQLAEVDRDIQGVEGELAKIEPAYESRNSQLKSAQEEMDAIRYRIEALYGKQGRGAQFRTKKERDAFLQQQINQLQSQQKATRAILNDLRTQVQQDENRIASEQDFLSKADAGQKTRNQQFKDIGRVIQERVQSRNELQEQRKAGWKELESLQEQIQEARHDLERGKQQLSSSLPRSISQGLATADAIAAEMNLGGYYGPLIDNFDLKNDAFRMAVEVAAGNALFHVIVDTDETAALLMKELDKRKAGRLTFLPLNRLRPQTIRYPDSNDVRPLIDIAINYDPDFDLAIRHVFGNKILARDLETAAHFSKEFDLDAVTRDGDVVNRRGGFEGGYRDERDSRIGTIIKIREATQRYIDLQTKERDLDKRLEVLERNINEVLRDLQKSEAERDHHKTSNEQLQSELSSRSKQLTAATKALEDRRRDIGAQEKELSTIEHQINDYTDEQKLPLQNKLTEAEKQELQTLLERRDPLLESIDSLQAEVMEINQSREKLRADLTNNLYKRRDDIQSRLRILGNAASASQSQSQPIRSRDLDLEVATIEAERKLLLSQIASIEKEIESLDQQRSKKLSDIGKLEKVVDKLRSEELSINSELAEATKSQDKLLNKRSMILESIQSKQRLIRDLGSVPKREVDDSKDLSEKELLRQLREVNERLKKYSSVNRKALDQYISFTEQRDTLVARKDELSRDYRSIQQLIDTLDAQKEDAILRTFRGVSHHFAEVFQELVPGGRGQLVMRTTDDQDLEEEDTEGGGAMGERKTSAMTATGVSRFLGIQVRVSFSGTSQQFQMQQLSGGQKAIVALTLIFAIQRCDPAPFYLFDEIDQALDASYRAGVARLIKKQAESTESPAQFITTTFRPELVAVADKCYGIALQNKVSNIYPLDKVSCRVSLSIMFDLINCCYVGGCAKFRGEYSARRSAW